MIVPRKDATKAICEHSGTAHERPIAIADMRGRNRAEIVKRVGGSEDGPEVGDIDRGHRLFSAMPETVRYDCNLK